MPQIKLITIPKSVAVDMSYALVILSQIIAGKGCYLSENDVDRLCYVNKVIEQAQKELTIIS